MNWKKSLEIGLVFVNVLIIIGFWMTNSGKILFSSPSDFFIGIGRLAGLLGVYFVLMQLIFIGRILWVERLFGLDKLARIHKLNGYFALGLLVSHPILLATGYGILNNVNIIRQLVNFVLYFQYVWMGAVALSLLIGVVFLSIKIVRSKLKYETWYFVHLLVYLVIILAFWHQLAVGSDFVNNPWFVGYWYLLYAFVIGNFVIFRFARPVFIYFKHGFVVENVVKENDNVTSIYIIGRKLNEFPVKPGQFMIFRFLNKKLWWQAHPFSMSMKPDGKRLRISVKNVGDYTSMISSIRKETKVFVDGPYGTFTEDKETGQKIALVASGIGITPIYSLLASMAGRRDITILYGAKTKEDLVFKKDIDSIVKETGAKVHYFLSQEKEEGFESGRIDKDNVMRLIPDFKEREFFICGPVPMMDGLIGTLKDMGLEKNRIHYERFAL